MKTITYYEVGDTVRIKEDWREWKSGDIAKVVSMGFERGIGSLQILTLESDTNIKAMNDFRTVYAYQVEFVS